MNIINQKPIDVETLFYCITGKFHFMLRDENDLNRELKKKGYYPNLLVKQDINKYDKDGLDILFTDYTHLDTYHRYMIVDDTPLIKKRLKEAKEII